MAEAGFETPTKRRLSSGSALRDGNENQLNFTVNDDDAEKRVQREEKDRQRRKSLARSPFKSPMKSPFKKNGGGGISHKLDKKQVSDLYSNCIKLAAENKINQKNTWTLNLIDHLDKVIEQQRQEDEVFNFQAAAGTIDASVKIYSYRVDAVHNDTYRVLGGLHRTDNAAGKNADGEQAGEQDKERRRKAGAVSTVELNERNLEMKELDVSFQVDPLFRKTSAAFDEGGARGLLLHNLAVRGTIPRLIFDSAEPLFEDAEAEKALCPEPCACESEEATSLFQEEFASIVGDVAAQAEQMDLCPVVSSEMHRLATVHGLAAYSLPSTSQGSPDETSAPATTDEDAAGSAGADNDDDDDSAAGEDGFFGLGGNDLDGFDGSESNEAALYAMIDGEEGAGALTSVAPASGETAAPTDVLALAAAMDIASEFSYFDTTRLRGWAGPAQWKYSAPASSASHGAESTTTTEKRSRSTFFIDFTAEPVDHASAFRLCRRGEGVLRKEPTTSTVLPEDVRYSVTDLFALHLRKSEAVVARAASSGSGSLAVDAVDTHWYDYDNPNDAENFCPDGAAYAGDSDGASDADELGDDADERDGGGVDLIDRPVTAEKISLNYARAATKVDVRALKKRIWSKVQKEVADSQETSFSSIVNSVPSIVPQQERAGVSVPYCFICLLHLANEKGLRIVGTESMDELTVVAETSS